MRCDPRRCKRSTQLRRGVLVVWLLLAMCAPMAAHGEDSRRAEIEADWLQQAQRWAARTAAVPKTQADAAGAVDGVKNGLYAFHTGREANPWWHVDLGQVRQIARVVVFNRLDYAPGLHNADRLGILTSLDGQQWQVVHEQQQHFGGVSGAPPLEVVFAPPITARWVRLQVRSDTPVFFHLDEVEIYGPGQPQQSLALKCRADQSSISQWSTNKLVPDIAAALPNFTQHLIACGLRLAGDLNRRGVDTRRATEQLQMLEAQLKSRPANWSKEETREFYFAVRWTVRDLVWTNPLLDFHDLLIVKRFTQETYPDVCLNHMPWVSRPGGDLCVVSLGDPADRPAVRPVLCGALGPGHVHGMDLHWDGERIVFGYAQARSDQPPAGWLDRTTNYDLRRNEKPIHLFEVRVDGSGLTQLTAGQWSDLDPTWLANDDIAFVSERCGCSLQCNEFDKDETSCNLYVMHDDGSNIRRLSASKDGDYLPHCLDDGTIGYCRWEYQERGWAHIQSIWTIRPDGTGADALFKQHLNEPWALEDARSIPHTGKSKLVAVAAGHHTLAAGPIVIITPSVGMNDPGAIRIVTPDVLPPEGGMAGTAFEWGGVRDGGGYYTTPWPLAEPFYLAAYSFSETQNDPLGYGIYLIDIYGNKELIYRDAQISCFAPIPLRPRPRPLMITDVTNASQRTATCAVADVSHGVEGVAPEQVKFIRISERLVWPYDNQFGGQRYHEVPHTQVLPPNWTPVRVLGEVPVEDDGSAHFQIPADTPVYFQLLDEQHMELRRMRSFISLQPGETRMCVGCHETRGEAPVSGPFPLAASRPPSQPQPPPWGTAALSFLRDIQPIFDQHCVSCHSGLKPAADLDFSRGLTARGVIPAFGSNRAYETIRVNELVARSNIHDDAQITQPLAFGSHRSILVQVLRSGTCRQRAQLSEQEWLRLVTWIDANAPYHANFIQKRVPNPPYDLPADQQLLGSIAAIHARRCQSCHETGDVTRPDWIDLEHPSASLFLTAPLATSAGGAQKCSEITYGDRDDPDYLAISKLVTDAVARAWKYPRRDLQTLLPVAANSD